MFILVDMLQLKPGKTPEEASEYFSALDTMFEKHGLKRQGLKIVKSIRGDLTPSIMNLFETADPQTSLSNMQTDPEFQAMGPTRDALFDLANSPVILTQKI